MKNWISTFSLSIVLINSGCIATSVSPKSQAKIQRGMNESIESIKSTESQADIVCAAVQNYVTESRDIDPALKHFLELVTMENLKIRPGYAGFEFSDCWDFSPKDNVLRSTGYMDLNGTSYTFIVSFETEADRMIVADVQETHFHIQGPAVLDPN